MTDQNFENNRFLDVVNEKDEIIDSKPRTDVHRLGLLHREVHVWMFDENKNIFFQKRGLPVSWSSTFDATIGGHVNKGEDYLTAAIRETKEETSLILTPDDLILLKKFRDIAHLSKDEYLSITNNFFRNIYIYRHAISEKEIKKEAILGVNFQKFAPDFLKNISKEDAKKFTKFILTKELPEVLKYMENIS